MIFMQQTSFSKENVWNFIFIAGNDAQAEWVKGWGKEKYPPSNNLVAECYFSYTNLTCTFLCLIVNSVIPNASK